MNLHLTFSGHGLGVDLDFDDADYRAGSPNGRDWLDERTATARAILDIARILDPDVAPTTNAAPIDLDLDRRRIADAVLEASRAAGPLRIRTATRAADHNDAELARVERVLDPIAIRLKALEAWRCEVDEKLGVLAEETAATLATIAQRIDALEVTADHNPPELEAQVERLAELHVRLDASVEGLASGLNATAARTDAAFSSATKATGIAEGLQRRQVATANAIRSEVYRLDSIEGRVATLEGNPPARPIPGAVPATRDTDDVVELPDGRAVHPYRGPWPDEEPNIGQHAAAGYTDDAGEGLDPLEAAAYLNRTVTDATPDICTITYTPDFVASTPPGRRICSGCGWPMQDHRTRVEAATTIPDDASPQVEASDPAGEPGADTPTFAVGEHVAHISGLRGIVHALGDHDIIDVLSSTTGYLYHYPARELISDDTDDLDQAPTAADVEAMAAELETLAEEVEEPEAPQEEAIDDTPPEEARVAKAGIDSDEVYAIVEELRATGQAVTGRAVADRFHQPKLAGPIARMLDARGWR